MNIAELFAVLGLDIDEAAFAKGEAAIDGLKEGLVGVVAAVGAAVLGLAAMAASTAHAGEEIARTAQRTGTNTEALQELRFAAEESGVATESLDQGLVHLSRSAFEATHGSADAAQAFRILGVNVRGANGQIRPTQDILGSLADRFQQMPDGANKVALAMRVFGRAGADMIPVLNKGRAGLAEYSEEANAFGVVLDDKTIAASREFVVAQREVEASLTGVVRTISGPFIPLLTKVAKAFTDWVKAHREWLKQKAQQGFEALQKVIDKLGKAFGFVVDQLWLLKPILGTILIYKGLILASTLSLTAAEVEWGLASVIAGARAAAASALAAAGAAAAALPWVLLAAVIYLVGEDMYYFFTGGDSLIGRYGGKWTKFLDDLLKPREGDNWLAAWFKASLKVLTDLQGAWVEFKDSLSMDGLLSGKLTGTRLAKAYGADVLPKIAPGFVQSANDLIGSGIDAYFGGGASPAAQASVSNSSRNSANVNMPITVNVPPGSSPEDTGKSVRDQVADLLQGHLNFAFAGTGSP